MTVEVRPLSDQDRAWVRGVATDLWGAQTVVGHGEVFEPAELAGFVAEDEGRRVGLLTCRVDGDACEVVTIDAFDTRRGIGTALMEAVISLGHGRVWLVTTNDNVPAQRFYEHFGFRLVAVREDEVERSRRLKPEIPLVGIDGIPIRDELEYELVRAD